MTAFPYYPDDLSNGVWIDIIFNIL